MLSTFAVGYFYFSYIIFWTVGCLFGVSGLLALKLCVTVENLKKLFRFVVRDLCKKYLLVVPVALWAKASVLGSESASAAAVA